MKKLFLIAVIGLGAALGASATEWEFFSLSFIPGVPSDAETRTVCGIKVGVPISTGVAPVYGVEAGVFWAGTDDVAGIQCSLIGTMSKAVAGLQFALLNITDRMAGLQLGIVNIAEEQSFQLGLVNVIKNSPLPFFPIINFRF